MVRFAHILKRAARWPNLLRIFLLFVTGVLIWMTLTPQGRLFSKTALFLPSLIPGAPFRPVVFVAESPQRTRLTFGKNAAWSADLYIPATRPPHPGMVVALGVNPAGPDDPRVRHLGEGLARMGVVALVPQSSNLIARTVTPDEIDFMVASFQLLSGRPEVDPARVGFLGLCVGSSLSVLAAQDPRINEQVRFVNWFGGYYRLEDLVVSTATRSFEVEGRLEPWEPDSLTAEVVKRAVIGFVESENDRPVLERALLGGESLSEHELATLSASGSAAYRLFHTTDPAEARLELARMPPSSKDLMKTLSPATNMSALKTRVWVMDDRGDRLIPYVHSRELAAELGARLARHSEFTVFSHVDLDRLANPARTLPQMWGLFRHVHSIFGSIL